MRVGPIRAAALAALMLGPPAGPAEAQHAPTRRKITETIVIDAPADKVWAVAGDLRDGSWIEKVARSEDGGGDLATGKRRLILRNGHAIVVEGRSYDPAQRRYAYSITEAEVGDLPAKDYSATLTVASEGDGRARVEWKAAFYRGHPNNDPPPELNDENSERAVRAWVHASLENLKARLEKGHS